jgi:hypothetical protein
MRLKKERLRAAWKGRGEFSLSGQRFKLIQKEITHPAM